MRLNRRRDRAQAALIASIEILENRQMLADTVGYAGGTYSQDFDGLINTGANQAPAGSGPFDLSTANYSAANTMDGWAYVVAAAGVRGATSTSARFRVDNGGGTTGSTYSYGTTGQTDRALGSLSSASNVSSVGVTLVNNTASSITTFTVIFDSEMWHRGNQATLNKLAFGYEVGGSIGDVDGSFTLVPQLDAPATAGTVDTATDGNNASFRTASITFTIAGIVWAPLQKLILRWADTNDTGNDDGIGIDNFKFLVPPPSPGRVGFSAATYSVNEDGGMATITVNRTNGNNGAVDVNYAATPGTASDPGDFTSVSGTLHWGDLDLAPKTFNVPITDNLTAEPTETVNLALSNPTGGATLDQSTATLSIIDNDGVAPTGLLLNEIETNPAGADNPYEYVELRGAASQNLDNVFFVSIEGDGGAAGLADRVVNLTGSSLGTNGLALLKSPTSGHSSQDAATAIIANTFFDNSGGGLENGANSFALIYSQNPVVQDSDLDPENDGVLNLPAGAVLLDEVGWKDAGVGTVYNVELTQSSGTPDAATRLPSNTTPLSASAWYNADTLDVPTDLLYETANASSNVPPGARLTPGATNYFNAGTAGAIGFTTASISVNENAGTLTVNVIRTAGSAGAVDVSYAAAIGTADGSDFTPITGTLHFDNGQTNNSFNVSITDDTTPEGAETIALSLSNPTGGALVAPRASATITIGPNDGGVVLNEVYANIPGGVGPDAPFEYIELRGIPGASLDGLFFLSIEGEIASTPGTADVVVPLTGAHLGSNGLLMIKATSGGYTPQDANTAIVTTTALDTGGNNLENGSNTFALEYSPATIAAGTDLDTGNDGGSFDNLAAGSELLDAVGWRDPTEASQGIIYGSAILTQSSGTPDAATRFPNDLTPNSFNAWYDGDIAAATSYATAITYDATKASANLPSGAVLTPGAINFPSDTTPPAIDAAAFEYDAAQQRITLDFSESVSASFTTDDITLLQAPTTTIPSANIIVGTAPGDVITLSFQNYPFNALPDGRYTLTVHKEGVTDAAGNPMAANYQLSFFVFDADANRDEKVNALDFNAIASHYGQSTSFTHGDFNYDGVVNTLDFNQLAMRFGQTLPFLPAPPAFASLFSASRVVGPEGLMEVVGT